jgi:hypothetical protein
VDEQKETKEGPGNEEAAGQSEILEKTAASEAEK